MLSDTNAKDPLELVVAELSSVLAKPSETIPSVRCISRVALVEIISDLAGKLGIPSGRIPSGTQAINRLLKAKLLHAVPFDDAAAKVGKGRLFAVGIGVDVKTIHPIELLQALVPSGIVCYMTALSVHDLTTQPTMHHHVARLETAPTRLRSIPPESRRKTTSMESARPVPGATPSLGQWQFTYQDVRYYLTLREPRFLRSFQKRYLSDKSWYRVTTLEQTLLDTLHRPASCGGPAIVFEAWDAARERLDTTALVSLLTEIGDDRLTRRAGFMLERLGLSVALPAAIGHEDVVSLLPGMPYTVAAPRWRVLVP